MKNNITQAVILAAGMGVRLKKLNNGIPKGFISLEDGKPIIENSIETLLAYGIRDITIVTGFMNEYYENLCSRYPQIKTIRNEKYSETGTMYSLWCARNLLKSDFILLESDLIFEIKAVSELLKFPFKDLILLSGKTEAGDEVYVEAEGDSVKRISKDRKILGSIVGEFVGISRISIDCYLSLVAKAEEVFDFDLMINYDTDGFATLLEKGSLKYLKIENLLWAEIDTGFQLERAKKVWKEIKNLNG